MGIEIIGKLTQKNNGDFKLVDLENVDYDGTGKSAKQELEKKIEEAKNSSTPYDDTGIKTDINTIKTDLGTEELTTTAKDVKGAVNEVNAQFKDIANKTITTEERTKLNSLKNYDDTSVKNDIQSQKARIDSLATLKEGSTTGDAELIDARTGADGKSFTNVGGLIRNIDNKTIELDKMIRTSSNNILNPTNIMANKYVAAWAEAPTLNDVVYDSDNNNAIILDAEPSQSYGLVYKDYYNSKAVSVVLFDDKGKFISKFNDTYVITTTENTVKMAVGWSANFGEFGVIKTNDTSKTPPFEKFGYSNNFAGTKEFNNLEYKAKKIDMLQINTDDRKNKSLTNAGNLFCKISNATKSTVIKTSNIARYDDIGTQIIGFSNEWNQAIVDIEGDFYFDTNNVYDLWIYATREDIDNFAGMQIKAYNNVTPLFDSGNLYDIKPQLRNGWTSINIPKVTTGYATKIEIAIFAETGKITNVVLDSITENRKIKPFIFICTDNGTSNCYSTMMPILERNNLKACTSITGATDMTKEQIQELYKKGWDFAVYGMDDFSNIKEEEWNTYAKDDNNYTAIKNGIKNIIDSYSSKSIPFPSAYFCRHNLSTDVLMRAVKENGIDLVRTSCENGLFSNYTINDMEIPCVGLTDSSLNNVKSYLDKAIKEGRGLCVFTHQIVTTADPTELNTLDTTYNEFCSYCKSYIDVGKLTSFNAKDVIDNFTNSDISTVKIRELEYKLKKLENN